MSSADSLDALLALSPSVALRNERFGALAYDFSSRRLTFLKSPQLVAVVRQLDGATSLREALTAAEIDPGQWSQYAAAVQRLVSTDMVRNAHDPIGKE